MSARAVQGRRRRAAPIIAGQPPVQGRRCSPAAPKTDWATPVARSLRQPLLSLTLSLVFGPLSCDAHQVTLGSRAGSVATTRRAATVCELGAGGEPVLWIAALGGASYLSSYASEGYEPHRL